LNGMIREMHGFPWIKNEAILRDSIAKDSRVRMLAICIAVGVIAGLVVAGVRLNLGLPGHKALFWMPAVIIARMLGRCRVGATAGAAATAFTTFALGGNLAGGPMGLPLVVAAGAFLDLVIGSLERGKVPAWLHVPTIGVAGMLANLICLTKRLFLPAGLGAHLLSNASGFWFQFCSYAIFGLAAGLIAAIAARFVRRRQCL